MSATADPEVRFTHLRPAAFRERRDAVALAWLPLGTLEWHGRHMPLGLDGVKAELLCEVGARRLGGVVFPTMWWADHRGIVVESLLRPDVVFVPEVGPDHRRGVNHALATSEAWMAAQGRRDDDGGVGERHVEVVLQALWTIRSYGFTRIVALAGHYPNAGPAEAAAERFHAAQTTCRVVAATEQVFAGIEPGVVKHADSLETSLGLALAPGLMDMDAIADEESPVLGTVGDDPRTATADYGWKVVDAVLAEVARQVQPVPPSPAVVAADAVDEDGTAPDWPDARYLRGGVAS